MQFGGISHNSRRRYKSLASASLTAAYLTVATSASQTKQGKSSSGHTRGRTSMMRPEIGDDASLYHNCGTFSPRHAFYDFDFFLLWFDFFLHLLAVIITQSLFPQQDGLCRTPCWLACIFAWNLCMYIESLAEHMFIYDMDFALWIWFILPIDSNVGLISSMDKD